ncbi:MAG: cephalosporin-C deacetylase [Fimbriimonadales bacterium]|nr:MAG: cephalosporin-C deacetylase [Fimbriimonadales bacterium]
MEHAVQLKKPQPPADFEAFWRKAVQEAESTPVRYERVHLEQDDHLTHAVYRLRWIGVDGRGREGWYAVPKIAPIPMPAVLYLPGYGVGTVPINENTMYDGLITFSINLHGYSVEPNVPYSPELGYFTRGIESPRHYIYRRIVQDSIVAMRVLAAQAEVNSNRLIAAGLSQGGGLAVMLGAWCSLTRCVVAELPALSYWEYLLGRPAWRYPIKEFTDYMERTGTPREAILETLQYYDAVNHAHFVRVPTQVSLALKDPGIRAPVVFSLYDALPNPKRLLIYEDLGHDWHPEMRHRLEEWAVRP